jgi:hypothetical protein
MSVLARDSQAYTLKLHRSNYLRSLEYEAMITSLSAMSKACVNDDNNKISFSDALISQLRDNSRKGVETLFLEPSQKELIVNSIKYQKNITFFDILSLIIEDINNQE